jgi:hypothetical protein
MPEKPSRPSPQAGRRAGRPQGDGRKDPEQIKRNQEHLGVGKDHKTPDMKKNHRGTFP